MANDLTNFVCREQNFWVRLKTHTVVNDFAPEYDRFKHDASGTVVRRVSLWVAETVDGMPAIQYYLGSVRKCNGGGWLSRSEVWRLFRRATVVALRTGEDVQHFRNRLGSYLRVHFSQEPHRKPTISDYTGRNSRP